MRHYPERAARNILTTNAGDSSPKIPPPHRRFATPFPQNHTPAGALRIIHHTAFVKTRFGHVASFSVVEFLHLGVACLSRCSLASCLTS